MMQLCQSETNPTFNGRVFACLSPASRVLFGVHLCTTHERFWKRRLEQGRKIRIHPERALTAEGAAKLAAVAEDAKICAKCHEKKPLGDYYRNSRGRGSMTVCKSCWNARIAAQKRAARAATKKLCARCGDVKTLEHFHRSGHARDGMHSWCISCIHEYDDLRRKSKASTEDLPGLPVVPAGVREIPAESGPSSEAPAPTARGSGVGIAWPCEHQADQTGGRRCIECCVGDRPGAALSYVLLVARGGTPERWRYLCPSCLTKYEADGRLAPRGLHLVAPSTTKWQAWVTRPPTGVVEFNSSGTAS